MITLCLSTFQSGETFIFGENSLYCWILEKFVTLITNLKLESWVFCTMFSFQNSVNMSQDCFLSSTVFNCEKDSFLGKRPIQLNLRETCNSYNRTIWVRIFSVLYNVPLWELWACPKIIPYLSPFSIGRNIHFYEKWPILLYVRETCNSITKPCKVESWTPCTIFPFQNWVHVPVLLCISHPI
jgi:hypothetical protein